MSCKARRERERERERGSFVTNGKLSFLNTNVCNFCTANNGCVSRLCRLQKILFAVRSFLAECCFEEVFNDGSNSRMTEVHLGRSMTNLGRRSRIFQSTPMMVTSQGGSRTLGASLLWLGIFQNFPPPKKNCSCLTASGFGVVGHYLTLQCNQHFRNK